MERDALRFVLDCLVMDRKDLETLELPKVLDRVAALTDFAGSRDLALALEPSADPEEVERRSGETGEARSLLNEKPELTIGGARDIRPQLIAAARGAVLEPSALLDIKGTLLAAKSMRRTLDKTEAHYPILKLVAEGLISPPDLLEAIDHALNDRGEVLDQASAKLARIRKDLRTVRDRLTRKLENLLSDARIASMLQEPIITQRGGRFVVPLKAEFKGQLKSVVHDQSSSGATLFVEPLQVVEGNNQIRELILAEGEEVRRILAELSRKVAEEDEALAGSVQALAKLDLALAKARYANVLGASELQMTSVGEEHHGRAEGPSIHLLAARHPLLDPSTVVPIDLLLDPETHALVITGPNTGGKTVSLKTAGLLALMAQCGLHLPVLSGSKMAVFDGIYADIGDEQSLEQSLSTFSAHVSNIVRILDRAGDRSLVLLDELGAGTDPQEGSALARALLETFVDRGSTVLVATHFAELKTYAHATPGVRNASVEFDLEKLSPTYHLTIGLPGRSNALAIAQRLGLEPSIVDRAKAELPASEVQVDRLLDDIHQQREDARKARAEAEHAAESARQLQAELQIRLDGIEKERLAIIQEAQERIEEQMEALELEIKKLRRRLFATGEPLEAVRQLETDLAPLKEDLAELIEADEDRRPIPGQELGDVQAPQVGDRVLVKTLDAEGILLDLTEDDAEVQIGRLRLRTSPEELRLAAVEAGPGSQVEPEVTLDPGVRLHTQAPPLELHLRGQTVDEALDALSDRLDAAYLSGMPFIRVIHGKGSGRLRQAIRQSLKEIPYVSSFEGGTPAEGGEGVTIVHLEQA